MESKGVDATIHLTWGKNYAEHRVDISCSPNGKIEVKGRRSYSLSLKEWSNNPNLQEEVLKKAYYSPQRVVYVSSGGGWRGESLGPCLPGNSFISTPNGFALIKDVQVGDFVWTVDRFGHRVQTLIVKKTKRTASKNHKVAHIILKDGRELVVSLGHPTIDYREIGSLVKGPDLDMSTVASIKTVPYKGKYTYDILPYGDTGDYWANNILIGSTLFEEFQKRYNKLSVQLFI